MRKHQKILFRALILLFLAGASLSAAHLAGAQVNAGINAVANGFGDNGLSGTDPRTIAARVINIALLFLGALAVGLIIWGGFIWMTSNGDEEKIGKAKKILKNGVIGLVIILSAWGIATFILSRLLGATGNGSNSTGCTTGQTLACGCGGAASCIDGAWGPCLNSDCDGNGPENCDGNSMLAGCQATGQICDTGSYCDANTCKCLPKGQLGDSCDTDPNTSACEASNDFCGEYLTCNPDTCVCYGPPVIKSVSPVGGFCEEDSNKSCTTNDDCLEKCNLTIPNGAVDNIITITGTNFGAYDPDKSKVVFNGGDDGDIYGLPPSTLNPDCIDSWTNNQIIIVVPSGAASGPLTVTTADGQTDSTDNDTGPQIADFIVNSIVRPGLCLLAPDSGLLSQKVNYHGINLYGGAAFFGDYNNHVNGLDSDFTNSAGLVGTTTIPNLEQGNMTSFVIATIGRSQEKSNYVNFIKEKEPDAGPYISYFEPTVGRAGQYVTIHGGGFGGARGTSQVFFGKVEADYNFPEICSDSVWRDQQIIVKVPAGLADGNYQIKVKLSDQTINSQNANPNVFTAAASSTLKTSICKIFPQRGQIGTPVSIWGEYFGNVGSPVATVFNYQRSTSTIISSDQKADRVQPFVPADSISGPVRVVKNSEWGNDVNFEIGVCKENADCGIGACCPSGTYKEGRCVAALSDCYLDIPTSVFEWGFATGYGSTTPTTTYDSCQGMARTLGACQINSFCPNSPGVCSPFAGGIQNFGACDATCNSVVGCPPEAHDCVYDSNKDICFRKDFNCALDTPFSYTLGTSTFNTIKTCKTFPQFNNTSHWQIEVSTSCPPGWTRLAGNVCVDSTSNQASSCALCRDGQSCKEKNGAGRCETAKLCADNAHCSGTQCLAANPARCDCCCEIGNDARDCCAPLTCSGTCGSDTTNDNSGFGECSGCAIKKADGSFDIEASDQACNCTNHSGKYCDTSVPTGACVDCSRLTTQASCIAHSDQCCFDSLGTATTADDVCRGGDGQEITNNKEDSRFGYCAYFDCQDASSTPPGNPELCASTTPKIAGAFVSITACEATCPQDPGHSLCQNYNGDLTKCSAAIGCCYNFKDGQCRSGDQITGGYCAYYNCDAAPNNKLCSTTPTTTGKYSKLDDCVADCPRPELGGFGKDCRNFDTTSTTDCDQTFCSSPLACLNNSGNIGLPGDCGTCCCKVGDPNSCQGIGIGTLTCQKNQAPCSGENRGLCCGCSQDADCGNPATVGCDSGACCRTRPAVITNQLEPPHGSTNVCRNAAIKIPFDQNMEFNSLTDNILLLEEHDYGTGVCPAGTFLAMADGFKPVKQNWLERTYARAASSVMILLSQLGLSSRSVLADIPSPSKLYCSVPGTVSISNDGNGSIAEFVPSKLLASATEYYLVVKGDEALDSNTGVMSQWQLGMNGNGYLDLNTSVYHEGDTLSFNNRRFKNSYIASFTTLSQQSANAGVCAVDYVVSKPSSYLFQTTDNDPNENDSDPTDVNFDTKADSDKVFAANAYSADDQLLHPTSGYYWDWQWSVAKTNIANLIPIGDLAENKAFVRAASGVSDDTTILSAQINMDRFSSNNNCNASSACVCAEPDCVNKCCNLYQDGDGLKADTSLFVFICKNPWPAVDPATLNWSPWYDTCEGQVGNGNCSNYNYKFYYCRDAGADGIADDLPAMINPAVIKGTGGNLICSEDQIPCSSEGERCGEDKNYDGTPDGFCIWNVLKESYFFKEAVPQVGAITAAIDEQNGSTVRLEWYGNSSLIYNPDPNKLGKYRIYYAPVSAGKMSFVDVKPTDPDSFGHNTLACTPTAPAAGANYSCHFRLPNLNVGQTYRFKVSAISVSQVESALSNEATATVTDKVPPAVPQSLQAESINDQRLRFTWNASAGASFYRLYHGVSNGRYGESFDSDNNTTTMEVDTSQFHPGSHYFALSALDASNNESAKSNWISFMITGQNNN